MIMIELALKMHYVHYNNSTRPNTTECFSFFLKNIIHYINIYLHFELNCKEREREIVEKPCAFAVNFTDT